MAIRADAHIAVIDQPGLLQGVRIPAAGEHNHAPTIAWTGLGVKPLYVGPSLRGRAMARGAPVDSFPVGFASHRARTRTGSRYRAARDATNKKTAPKAVFL